MNRSKFALAICALCACGYSVYRIYAQNQLPDPQTLTLAQLRAETVNDGDEADGSGRERVADWVESHDLDATSVDDLTWLAVRLGANEKSSQFELRVEWTGSLIPTKTGSFLFSGGAESFALRTVSARSEQSVRIWVDGTEIAGSSIEAAVPVSLEAGQAVPVRVELSHLRDGRLGIRGIPVAAALRWKEANSGEFSTVPSASLKTASGDDGMAGTYSIKVGKEEDEFSRVDPDIDFVWNSVERIKETNQAAVAAVTAELVGRLSAAEVQTTAELLGSVAAAESHERRRVLGILLDRPGSLKQLTPAELKQVSQTLADGEPEAAMQVIISWCNQNPNYLAEISGSFRKANRDPFRAITDEIVLATDTGKELLESKLVNSGQLNLPAAYLLSYVTQREQAQGDWITRLNEKLTDKSIAGDARVNWLLARAQAEEIKHDRSERYVPGKLDVPLAGREWIEEADLTAESDEYKRRAVAEYIARLVDARPASDVDAYLNQAAQRFGDISDWQAKATAIHAQKQERLAWVKQERQRRDLARSNKN